MEAILIFSSIHHTLKAEAVLTKAGTFSYTTRPLPPWANRGCGMGIQIQEKDLVNIRQHLEKAEVVIEKVVQV